MTSCGEDKERGRGTGQAAGLRYGSLESLEFGSSFLGLSCWRRNTRKGRVVWNCCNIANEPGAGHPQIARLALHIVLAVTVIKGILLGLIILLLRNVWGYTYSNETEVVRYISIMMTLLATSNFIDGLQCVLSGLEENIRAVHGTNRANRDCISWEAIIVGYAQNGNSEEALGMFVQMKRDSGRINRPAFTCVLSTFVDIAAFEFGSKYMDDLSRLDITLDVMSKMHSYQLIISYARHGFGKQALRQFESMKEVGIRSNDVTMVGVLPACGHTGLIDKFRDTMHPDNKRIYAFLEELELLMKQEGYVFATKLVMHDVDEEEKAHLLKYHSEIGPA
ncbi:hypothetical protein MTR67_013344 [Solanum verrucosum]|uniref:Pentatricopeptide repeat-containing protein n=1 Tax=Solanum verrucosum TaxID=315347 RepID=A0AAF0TIC3_SOLVR|nr:hypothetical protein MTR67_013344 [Solanum verrucosum]